MKSLEELFEACGGNLGEMAPIEIALKVLPIGINLEEELVAFRIDLEDRLVGTESGELKETAFSIEFVIPLEAIELVHS